MSDRSPNVANKRVHNPLLSQVNSTPSSVLFSWLTYLAQPSIDTIGLHYPAAFWRWYKNWQSNRDRARAICGDRWYRVWEYFLASASITCREGPANCYQITLVKKLNSTHRIEGVSTQFALSEALAAARKAG